VAILPCVAPCRHSFLSAALPSAIYFCSFLPARFPPAFASIIYQWIRTGTTRSVSIFKNCEKYVFTVIAEKAGYQLCVYIITLKDMYLLNRSTFILHNQLLDWLAA
jgi:hypothetical protein